MIKRVSVAQLCSGMYIHDLNCSWIDHPFARRRFKINGKKQLSKIKSVGIREVYIDTDKGSDITDSKPIMEVHADIRARLSEVTHSSKPPSPRFSFREELLAARKTKAVASKLVTEIMSDVKLGKQIEITRLHPVVDDMVSSIFRNQHTLLAITRLHRVDAYTFEHSVGVAVLLIAFAKNIGLERDIIGEVGIGGLLHDVGKSTTPEYILNKPGKLTEQEFDIMRCHVLNGYRILKETPGVPENSISIAAEHHERFDGSGYPKKKSGKEITRFGQMAAIVDVYDALTSDRVYHDAELPQSALGRLLEWSKFHFNPELVKQFIHCVGIYPVGTMVVLSSGLLGVVVDSGSRGLLYPVVRVFANLESRRYLKPYTIDLSGEVGKTDRIIRAESPGKWGFYPEDYLE